jgi:hypothetical protein
MDAIPLPYCLQHLYYSQLLCVFNEYVNNTTAFEICDEPGAYHLPTWRYDLLPDSFFDMIICVQVLQELNPKLVRFMIDQFRRTLKPGGALYIRDHDLLWQPAHKIDLNRYLPKWGFRLEFRPHIIDGKDIHGLPRIWRKEHPEVLFRRTPFTGSGVIKGLRDITDYVKRRIINARGCP